MDAVVVVVDFPLCGEWTVERTPAERIPSHGTETFGQRYAYDLIRTDERYGVHVHPAGTVRWLLIGGRTRNCFGWGQPVHASFAGEVLEVVDSVSERRLAAPRDRDVGRLEERVRPRQRSPRPRPPCGEPRHHRVREYLRAVCPPRPWKRHREQR
jgi:hypothetical protein